MRSTIPPAVIVAAVLLGGSVAGAQQAPLRLAYVNPQALFEHAPGRAEAQAAFQKETDGYRGELSRMSDALTTMVAAYQRDEAKLTAADKERRQRAIAAKEDSLRQRQQTLEQVAAQRQGELMAPIMESVRKVLEEVRVEEGFAMILNSDPASSPILAADKSLDITDRVVARLKSVATKAAAPATKPATGAPANAPSGVTRPKPPGM